MITAVFFDRATGLPTYSASGLVVQLNANVTPQETWREVPEGVDHLNSGLLGDYTASPVLDDPYG